MLRQLLLPLTPFPALFVAAALITFLLDIPARWLWQRGLPRGLAIALVLGVSLGLVALAVIWLVPRLVEQLGELVAALPGWLAQVEVWLDRLEAWASQLSQRLLGLLRATLGLTVNTVIVLVLAVFLLLGGELLVATLNRTFCGFRWPAGADGSQPCHHPHQRRSPPCSTAWNYPPG